MGQEPASRGASFTAIMRFTAWFISFWIMAFGQVIRTVSTRVCAPSRNTSGMPW